MLAARPASNCRENDDEAGNKQRQQQHRMSQGRERAVRLVRGWTPRGEFTAMLLYTIYSLPHFPTLSTFLFSVVSSESRPLPRCRRQLNTWDLCVPLLRTHPSSFLDLTCALYVRQCRTNALCRLLDILFHFITKNVIHPTQKTPVQLYKYLQCTLVLWRYNWGKKNRTSGYSDFSLSSTFSPTTCHSLWICTQDWSDCN